MTLLEKLKAASSKASLDRTVLAVDHFEALLAVVDAVMWMAKMEYHGEDCPGETAEELIGDEPVGECECGLTATKAALAPFTKPEAP